MPAVASKTIDEFKIILIEDDNKIARRLKKLLQDNLEPNLPKNNLKVEFVHVENMKEFVEIERSPGNRYIVDLNLGGIKGEDEGFEILEILHENRKEIFKPIVYTASDTEGTKNRCLELGIDEKHFISKRNLRRDLNTIEQLIHKDFNEYIANPEDFGHVLKEEGLDHLRFNRQHYSVHLKTQYISVFSDLIKCYDRLTFNSRIAACKFFLEPFRLGYNFYGINGEVIELHAEKDAYDSDSIKRTKYFSQFLINRDNLLLEKMRWGDKQEKINELSFSTMSELREFFTVGPKTGETGFFNDLAELFAARRLAFFYLHGNPDTQEEVAKMGIQLKNGAFSFITQLWEDITTNITEDAGDTRDYLQTLSKMGFPDIEEIFFCKIIDPNEEEGYIDTEIFSLEDTSHAFPRAFDYKLLEDAGIKDQEACFKLIIYHATPAGVNPGGRTFFIEPIPVSTYHQKLY